MLLPIVNKLTEFRNGLYQFFRSRRDASFELVDALASNQQSKQVVGLSLEPCYRRNYCSITRSLDEFYTDKTDLRQTENALTNLIIKQVIDDKSSSEKQPFHLLAVDSTPEPRCYSPTQADRTLVYSPNVAPGNKPITVGHQYSIVTYLPKKTGNCAPWVVPLSCHRVNSDEKSAKLGMEQIRDCIETSSILKNTLCVSVADSHYAQAESIKIANEHDNQVHIARVRSNRVLYYPLESHEPTTTKRGRKKRYGNPFRLKDPSTQRTCDEKIELTEHTRKGKPLTVKIQCWNDIRMRGHRDCDVSKQPLRVVKIELYDASNKKVFKKPLWLMISGKRQMELSLKCILSSYRQRFDIEHFFRFGKNRLLFNKTQTPEVEHEQAWWQFGMMAYVQLYLAKDLAHNMPTPWDKYLPKFKNDQNISPTQVQKDFGRIIGTFGTPAQPPKPRKKAKGRALGEKQIPRERYPVIIKSKKADSVLHSP